MRRMCSPTIVTRKRISSREVWVSFKHYSKSQSSKSFFVSARARTKAREGVTEGWFAKFPKDVIYCEQLTNGNPNILNEEPFAEKKKEKKIDYSLIFGDPEEIKQKRKEEIQKSVARKIKATREEARSPVKTPKKITHPRFLGHSDYKARILTQPSTPFHLNTTHQSPHVSRPGSHQYTCALCQFSSSRVNVMMLHSKSHSDPSKTSLANYAKMRSDSETRVKSEVKGSRLFADAKTTLAKKRKLTFSTPKTSNESETKKTKTVKKTSPAKSVKVKNVEKEEVVEEKKNSIFGDWSEDENEEEEEKVKLQESINNIADEMSVDSDEEYCSFKTNKQLNAESSLTEKNKNKSSVNKKVVKRKSKKKQSATDAVQSLLNSSLKDDDLDDDGDESPGYDEYSDNYDEHESSPDDNNTPPPSPPPTTPSKKPVILKKSSTRSFQLPSRPDGKLELIKHDSLETSKFAGTSARAKAKQLARSQLSSNELFDKLIESDTNKNNDASDDKVQISAAESANSSNIKEASSPSSESPKKKIEAYDFDCDDSKEPVKPNTVKASTDHKKDVDPEVAKSPVKTSSPSKTIITPKKDSDASSRQVSAASSVKDKVASKTVIIKSPQNNELKPSTKTLVTVSRPVIVSKPSTLQQPTQTGESKKIIIQKPPAATTQKTSNKMIIDKQTAAVVSSPARVITLQKPVLATIDKTTLESGVKKAGGPPPVIQPSPVTNSEKPVVAGLSKPKITNNIVLSPPVSSPSKQVVVTQKQEKTNSTISLNNKTSQEKSLTISLESSKKTVIKPIVKTVDIPKQRISKVLANTKTSSAVTVNKPIVRLETPDKTVKTVDVKLDKQPAAASTVLVNDPGKSAPAPELRLNGNNTAAAVVDGLQIPADLPVVGGEGGDMIYLLVEDGSDANLENQTLFIDPSQLAAAAAGGGGLVLASDGAVPMLIQTSDSADTGEPGGQILMTDDTGALSNLVILEDKVHI